MSTSTTDIQPVKVDGDIFGNSEQVQARIAKAEHSGLEACVHCGRSVGAGRGHLIEVVNGGDHVQPNSVLADNTDPGYMGCFPIGSTCAKKLGIPTTHLLPL